MGSNPFSSLPVTETWPELISLWDHLSGRQIRELASIEMTSFTVSQLAKALGVTIRAGATLVDFIQFESRAGGMIEGRDFLCRVALVAFPRDTMAATAIRMTLLRGWWNEWLSLVMATATVFFFMAVGALESIQTGVGLVVEGYHGSIGLGRGLIDPFIGHLDVGMQLTHEIGGILPRGGGHLRGACQLRAVDTFEVALCAIDRVTPLAMTTQALTVIGAFDSGLAQIGGIGGSPMAFTAGADLSGWIVMMTGRASRTHDLHVCMEFVRESHGLIEIH